MLTEKQFPAAATGVEALETQAREAFEQSRTREGIALTKALLSADPENLHGQSLHSAIQREMQGDLNDASALLEESRSGGAKYRKAAEIILLKALYLDPDNEQAKALLTRVKGTFAAASSSCLPAAVEPNPDGEEEIPPTVRTQKKEKPRRLTIPMVLVVALVLGTGLVLLKQSRWTVQGATSQNSAAQTMQRATEPAAHYPTAGTTTAEVWPGVSGTLAPTLSMVKTTNTSAFFAEAGQPGNSFDSDRPIAFVEAGTLAVSSPAAAEIYMDGKLLGPTPLTLQLLAGGHTLEYRHGDLRTVVTHNIKPNQTTTALINFDVTVQINARPWAQVFLEGTARRALGQTPLSDIRVPLGSVLVFENPDFPPKNYRVTEADGAIQVVF